MSEGYAPGNKNVILQVVLLKNSKTDTERLYTFWL